MSWWVYVEPPNMPVDPFEENVTYNLGTMMRRAGLHPKVLSGLTVKQAQPVFEQAEKLLSDNPAYFQQFNPENGWGNYEGLMKLVRGMLAYMEQCPDNYIVRWS